jgi:hypothetical protein
LLATNTQNSNPCRNNPKMSSLYIFNVNLNEAFIFYFYLVAVRK